MEQRFSSEERTSEVVQDVALPSQPSNDAVEQTWRPQSRGPLDINPPYDDRLSRPVYPVEDKTAERRAFPPTMVRVSGGHQESLAIMAGKILARNAGSLVVKLVKEVVGSNQQKANTVRNRHDR